MVVMIPDAAKASQPIGFGGRPVAIFTGNA